MTATHSSGPEIVYGVEAGTTKGSNPEAGPSITYQGSCIFDVRYPYGPGTTGVGKVKGVLDSPYTLMVDSVPSQFNVASIAAAANVTSGTAMTLVSTSGNGVTIACPVFNTTTNAVVNVPGIDVGFTIGTTTSGSASVTASVTSQMLVGMPIAIVGAGASGTTLFTTVLTITSSTAFTTKDAAGTSVTGASIATPNGSNTAIEPYVIAGAGRIFDPTQGICRGISITGAASGTGGDFIVSGLDIYGVPMTEKITATAGATTKYGFKAFKYIVSVVPQFTDAHNYSIGHSDLFGLNLRNDRWEYDNFYWAGAFLTASTGWTAADTTSPATNVTKDVRGSIQIGAIGPNGSGASGGSSDGSKRLALFATQPLFNLTSATTTNTVPMFGVTQA